MRRLDAVFLLAVSLLPSGLGLFGAVGRGGAAHCAMRCPHHGSVAAGASCCPVEEPVEAGCSLRKCSGEEGSALALVPSAQPWILPSRIGLAAVRASRPATPFVSTSPSSASPSPPDHVPLLFA